MTTPQKSFWKYAGSLITIGGLIIGVIYGAGKLTQQQIENTKSISTQSETLKDHEKRLQTVETAAAVQLTDQNNMKESIKKIEASTSETNQLLRQLLQEKRR